MAKLDHIEDVNPRGPDYGHPNLGQRFRAAFPWLFEQAPSTVPTGLMASTIQQVPASTANYTVGRLGYKITGIIIHTSVGTMAACDAAFQNPARQASAHYAIPYNGYADSPIHQYVSEANIAWHCGRFYPDSVNLLANANTIGIEHIDNGAYNSARPDALYAVSAQLVKEICTRYGIPINRTHIRKHKEVSVSPTACPDSLDIDRIVAMASGQWGGGGGILTSGDDDDMLYIGPTHAKAATFRVFTAGRSYRERSTDSPAVGSYAVGASVVVSGYSYSNAPVTSADLGGGVPGPDYLWWQVGTNWIPDAILDTSTMVNFPPPTIPAAEPLDTLFATQTQVKAIPAGPQGIQGIPGVKGDKGDQGLQGIPGVKGDQGLQGIQGIQGPAGTVPDHKHTVGTTSTEVV